MIRTTPQVMQFILACYAYEIICDPFMEDAEWDAKALEYKPQMQELVKDYEPYTGMWIHAMDLRFLGALYNWCTAQESFSCGTIEHGTLKINEQRLQQN